jgi:vacuolar protein sorting-associated protein 45
MANTTSVRPSEPVEPSESRLTLSDFSNIVKKSALERLAEADDYEVVRAVQEHFADFQVINPDLMAMELSYPRHKIWSTTPDMWNSDLLQRSTEGLLALLLSLKKRPLIRFGKTSLMAKKLATEVRYQMNQEEQLFNFRRTDTPPILLVLDRREDPITPLLTQWTYQAMVHELLGIHTGRVDLKDVPDVRPELRVSIFKTRSWSILTLSGNCTCSGL